jgi:DNA-directed RNA polymerase specialized sigma24 family protein
VVLVAHAVMVTTPCTASGRPPEGVRSDATLQSMLGSAYGNRGGSVRGDNRSDWIRVLDRPLVTALTDEELAIRAQTNPAFFSDLYERYAARVYRFVMGHIGDRQAAEDVTGEVFLKALRGIGGFRPGHPFRAWLFQIAVNASIDHLRSRRAAIDIDGLTGQIGRQVGLDEQVILRDEVARVARALADFATTMGRSEGAVKVLIHRGLSTLRARLQSLDRAGGQEGRA